MPSFLAHMYSSPRQHNSRSGSSSTAYDMPAAAPASAPLPKGLAFSAARKLAFLRAPAAPVPPPVSAFPVKSSPTSVSTAAPSTSAVPASTAAPVECDIAAGSASVHKGLTPAWLNTAPRNAKSQPRPMPMARGRTPAAALHRTRKSRPTTRVELASVEAKRDVQPAQPEPEAPKLFMPRATPAARGVALRALAMPGATLHHPTPPTLQIPAAPQTNIIPFPMRSPLSPIPGSHIPVATTQNAAIAPLSAVTARSEESEESGYVTALESLERSVSTASSDSSASSALASEATPEDSQVAEESDTSVEDVVHVKPQTREPQPETDGETDSDTDRMAAVISAFPEPPSFVPVAFPGPSSPITSAIGTHHLLKGYERRTRRESTTRPVPALRATPQATSTRSVSIAPTMPHMPSSTAAPPLAASASVPPAASSACRRMGALPRRSIVDDREVGIVARSRSPVLGRPAAVHAPIEPAVESVTEPVSDAQDVQRGQSSSDEAVQVTSPPKKLPESPPPYCVPPPPYTLSPPLLAAPTVSIPSITAVTVAENSSRNTDEEVLDIAPQVIPEQPSIVAPVPIAPVKRHSLIPVPVKSKTANAQATSPPPLQRTRRIPSGELRLLVFLYRTVVAGLERRYRAEQAAAREAARRQQMQIIQSQYSPGGYSFSSCTSSSGESSPKEAGSPQRSPLPSPRNSPPGSRGPSPTGSPRGGSPNSSRSTSPTGFAAFPLVEDDARSGSTSNTKVVIEEDLDANDIAGAVEVPVMSEDDDEVVLHAPTPCSSPTPTPYGSGRAQMMSGWHIPSPVRSSSVSSRSSTGSSYAARRSAAAAEHKARLAAEEEARRRRIAEERRLAEEQERQRRLAAEEARRRERERAELDVQDAVLAIRLRKLLKAQGVSAAELDAREGETSPTSSDEENDLELPEGVSLEELSDEGEDEDAEAMAACEEEMRRLRMNAQKAAMGVGQMPGTIKADDDDQILIAHPLPPAASTSTSTNVETPAVPPPTAPSGPRTRTPSGASRPPRALRASPPPPKSPPRDEGRDPTAIMPACYMIALLTMRHRYAVPPRGSKSPNAGSSAAGSSRYGYGGSRSRLGVCAWMGVDGVVVEDESEAGNAGGSVWDCESVVDWYAGGME